MRHEQALSGKRLGGPRPRGAAGTQASAASRIGGWRSLLGATQTEVRERRWALGVRPVFKRVDTCAAEFDTRTAYMYSTYEEECEVASQRPAQDHGARRRPQPHRPGHRIRLLLRARGARLREDGFETIMVNCNPETVSTDYDTSDRLYFEPLTLEDVLEIVAVEKPKGVIVQYGGQTPLKLARDLEANGVPIIGTSPDMIDCAEDRERFQQPAPRPRAQATAQPHRTRPALGAGAGPGDRLPGGGAAQLRARRARHGDRAPAERPRALHARGGEACPTIRRC